MAPAIVSLLDNLNPDLNLDVASLPASQEMTRHLFPNLAVTTDDGKVIRLDSHASLVLPFDLAGLDPFTIFLAFGLSRF
jgi:hypothetical protein